MKHTANHKLLALCAVLLPLLAIACLATPDDFAYDRQHLADESHRSPGRMKVLGDETYRKTDQELGGSAGLTIAEIDAIIEDCDSLPNGANTDGDIVHLTGQFDEYEYADEFVLLPSEIERAAFNRRLRPMVCVISERDGYKGQIQNVGNLVGALENLQTDDPVIISAVYLMDSGIYLERLVEIPRSEIVEAFEIARVTED